MAAQGTPNRFARVGMSHVTRTLGQPYVGRMRGLSGIHINTSGQPNANPHFGTVTTLMCVAAIAEVLQVEFDCPVSITWDQLENAPDRQANPIRTRNVRGAEVQYFMSLADSRCADGQTVLEANLSAFRRLFAFFQEETGIEWRIRTYRECQDDPHFRRSLLGVLGEPERYSTVLGGLSEAMRLRFPCPICRWVDKASVHTVCLGPTQDGLAFEAFCPDHGRHTATLTAGASDFFDTNTPLRDIAKVPGLIEEGIRSNRMPLMVDGRDWSGRWDRCIHVPGVTLLGYDATQLPARIYPPAVTDPLGAKLSKSLYVGSGTYDALPPGFADFNAFMQTYGTEGLYTLWNHVRQWAADPAYMDRDSFTILYFQLLLEGKLGPAQIMG